MSLPINIQAGDHVFQVNMASLTVASYVVVPVCGRVKDFSVTNAAATTTATETYQLSIQPAGASAFTNITNGVVTMASGAAAGSVSRITLPVSSDAYLTDGAVVKIAASGGAAGTVPVTVTIVVGP